MPLQTQNLVMLGLSVQNDYPPNQLQPQLVDGIHLRWAFTRDIGFPWYGYYLFRRLHGSADPSKTKVILDGTNLPPGSTTLNSATGRLTSDSTLVQTNFSPTGEIGFDLDLRSYLRFAPSELANLVEVRIGLRQNIPPTAAITITALLQGSNPAQKAPVAQEYISGHAGDVIVRSLQFDAISAIEINSGPAVLIGLSFVPVAGGQLSGWAEVPSFPYPMGLPVLHPDYPCNPGAMNRTIAEKIALRRVLYGPRGNWAGENFADLHMQLLKLVKGGPKSLTPMAKRFTSPPLHHPQPSMPKQYPLDLVLLGALHPAIAQMVGLYWVDQQVIMNESYDYLIVAAHKGTLGNNAIDALHWLSERGFSDVDAFIVFNKSLKEPAPPLEAPSGLKTYFLSSASLHPQPENNVGLRWNLDVSESGVLLPGKPVMYHLWRAGLGNGEIPPAPGSYDLITKSGPVLVVEPAEPTGKPPQRPPDWPPDRMHYLDCGLADGWYSYQVSGIDIFGRHSRNSSPGPWYQWTPAPDPPPWYFKDPPPADSVVHPSAVRLLDKLPPPPPTGIEAYALDPADSTVLKDEAYNAWWNSLTACSWYQALPEREKQNLIGLRVRWQWTHAHMRQAPDTREFRIYYHPGPVNVLMGKIVSVTAASSTDSEVTTSMTLPNPPPFNAYKGLWLQVGNDAFKIVSSQARNPLQMRVTNIGPKDDIQPPAGVPCAITLPDGHVGFVDYSVATNWQERYYVVDYDAHATQTLLPARDSHDIKLGSSSAGVSGAIVFLDGAPDLSAIQLIGEHLFLESDTNRTDKTYPITAVDNNAKTVTLDGTPNIGSAPSAWEIGFPLRSYEVFLPAAGDTNHEGLPLATSIADPIAYAYIGVSTADDKTYTSDNRTTGGWSNRSGNEGRVGAPAKIFRVRRELPLAPTLPPADSDKVFATPAGYHGHSFYTFRWVPISNVKTHVFRALDESIFMIDWLIRSTRGTLDPVNPQHEAIFPEAWSPGQKQAAASQLNAITSIASYAALSSDAQEVLARLPGNEGATGSDDIQQRDWQIRTSRKNLDASSIDYFPDEWKPTPETVQMQQKLQQKRQAAAADLNGIASAAGYQTLSQDALRVLAGLPGNERAFTQLTIQPLDPDDPANFDRRGPDNADNYMPNALWRAYTDTLDGHSSNCYFYRAGSVDGVHNRSKELSLSSPPVYCPDIVPPRAPVITKVFAGETTPGASGNGKITLQWASNREPDVAEYRVYRANSANTVRDLWLMVHVEQESREVSLRIADLSWSDTPPQALRTFYYRIVAVDNAGNRSGPSQTIAGRAFDESLPAPAISTVVWVQTAGGLRAQITWSSADETLLQRRERSGGPWIALTGWRPSGSYIVQDSSTDPTRTYDYRLRGRMATGAEAFGVSVSLIAAV